MKKPTIIMIISVLLLTIVVIGSTYAFFSASIDSNNMTANASKFEVIYTGNARFDKQISLSTSKVEESSTSVNIRLGEGSVAVNAILYIMIENISEKLAVDGFNWEVYGYKNNKQEYYNSGTFEGKNSTTNNTINIVENYLLSEDNTEIKVYLWLDGNKVGNEVMNTSFKGYIGAKTENFSGELG